MERLQLRTSRHPLLKFRAARQFGRGCGRSSLDYERVESAATALQQGAIILADYGYPAAEYYHPQRSEGTLMCYYQHQANVQPFDRVGCQDITVHVDFTRVARAARQAGLVLAGYTTQSAFLINCGIQDAYIAMDDPLAQFNARQAMHRLLSPNAMGQVFKVMMLTTNDWQQSPIGFQVFDQSERLACV